MKKINDDVMYDIKFIKGHTLQPVWFKILKIFILIAVIGGYVYFGGWVKAAIFLLVFFLLAMILHFTYRIKTKKFTQSWLDFKVREENNKLIYQRIGIFYYSAIILFALIAYIISQILPIG